MRKAWAAWKRPIVIVVGITAFVFALFGGKALFAQNASRPALAGPPPAPAQHVNTGTWRMIARDPAGHVGERVVLWGQVTGLDPAGASTFRANVDAARHAPTNGSVTYPTSVIMHGDPDVLRKVANGYIFTAEATVDGAGAPGAATTPTLTVTKLRVTDKTVG